jgi:iron complex transport system substrate-binding protein
MNACSFLPAATRMIYDMGLQEFLLGVTFECQAQALTEKPVVVRCMIDSNHSDSAEIDKMFSSVKANGESLYYIDEKVLKDINPEIIFTQDTCNVCQIDSKCTAAAISKLNKKPTVISLSPDNLEDVYGSARTIARALRQEKRAELYLDSLKKRTNTISDLLIRKNISDRPVMMIEWIDPVYNCGHWIPEQISLAGGFDHLGNRGGHSEAILWEKVLNYNPEVLLIAPCGFDAERTIREMHLLTERPGWNSLRSVRSDQVYLIDFDLFTQPSAGTLTDGIELLAALIHPDHFSVPPHLATKFKCFIGTAVHVSL